MERTAAALNDLVGGQAVYMTKRPRKGDRNRETQRAGDGPAWIDNKMDNDESRQGHVDQSLQYDSTANR